jgi:hypothetical protein
MAADLADYCDRSGINNVICWFNMGGQPHQQVLGALEIFRDTVIPAVTGQCYNWTQQRTVTEPAAAAD